MLDVMYDANNVMGNVFTSGPSHVVALTLALLVTFFVAICVLFLVFYFMGMYRLYKKLGLKGWYVFIPFYDKWVLLEKLGLEWYWFLILMTPVFIPTICKEATPIAVIIALIANLAYIYNISKRFNKSKGWIIIAFFFDEIALPILGLAKNDIPDETVTLTANAMFDDKKKETVASRVKKASKKIEKIVQDKTKTEKDK